MKYFAEELGYDAEKEYWGLVGLLHDIDFLSNQDSSHFFSKMVVPIIRFPLHFVESVNITLLQAFLSRQFALNFM